MNDHARRPPFWRSISFRIQFWHATMLALAIAGMMAGFYRIQAEQKIDEVDVQLSRVTRKMLPEIDRPARRRPPPPEEDFLFPGERDGPRPRRGWPRKDATWQLDEEADPWIEENAWAVAWDREGDKIFEQGAERPAAVAWNDGSIPEPFSTVAGERVMYFRGPRASLLATGVPLDRVQAELHTLAIQLGGAGLGMFIVGVLVGWGVTRWGLRPARDIAAAAREVAYTDRSRRIDASRSASELHELALVLNDSFDKLQGEIVKRERFTADASHEFRTPLTVVLGQTERLLAKPREPEEYRKGLGTVHQSALRLKEIVEQMMTLAHLDEEALRATTSLDLSELAAGAIGELRQWFARRDAVVSTDLQAAPLNGDPQLLARLLSNLLANAIRHNPPGTRVEVATGSGGGYVFATVTDHGRGIPAEHLPNLFERFYRVDSSRTDLSGEPSSGLGLAICRKVAELHGGTLEVASREGEGSTFTLRLPVPDPAEPSRGKKPKPVPSPPSPRSA
ncbi:sensor histidine kinase [Haloferula sargassicola]|uniref:histidine kinase n=1 Tax=Haloferula sargassicola TaxID=490096 RepID=A0ABP9UQW4_9BACT